MAKMQAPIETVHNPNFIGERISQLRGRRSQAEIARAAGIDKASLNRIERGKNPNALPATIEKIAQALDVTKRELEDPDYPIPYGGVKGQPLLRELQALHREQQDELYLLRLAVRDLRAQVKAVVKQVAELRRTGDRSEPGSRGRVRQRT